MVGTRSGTEATGGDDPSLPLAEVVAMIETEPRGLVDAGLS